MRLMDKPPFFSIITICRNNLDGVKRCIRNVRNQGFGSYEHWVIDGGSSDGTVDFLSDQADPRLEFVSESDDGIYHAINKGLSRAKGEVISLLHSDDMLSHGALKRVYDCFACSDVDAVYGDALYFGDDGRFIKYKPARFYQEEVVIRGMPAAHEAMFIRKSVYESAGFYDETYRSAADYKMISNLHLGGIRTGKTYHVELYKLVGGVSFGSDVDKEENFRLMREHIPTLPHDLYLSISALKNFRAPRIADLGSVYDCISRIYAPNWFYKALLKSLIKIQIGDASEADPDPIRGSALGIDQIRDKRSVLFTIAGLKGVAGGAEKVLVNLVNELRRSADIEILVSTAEGKAGVPHYKLDPAVKLIDIYEKPNDQQLSSSVDLRSEVCEIVDKLPEELLFVVSECVKCRNEFENWPQFVNYCRANSLLTPREIRQKLRDEVDCWVRKYGTRVSRWRKLITLYGVDSVVAFMISTSAQLFVAVRKTRAQLIISNHGNPIRDYLYQDDWDNSRLDRAIRLFALYAAKANHWLDKSFLEYIPNAARKKAFVLPNPVTMLPSKPEKLKAATTKTIVSVGRLVGVKRHDVLIKAFARSDLAAAGWRLRIFGDGPLLNDLRDLVSGLSLERNVVLEGVTDELSEPLSSASFFVSCSEMEGFGLAAAEALSLSIPVVADADTSGLNGLVHDGKSGLLVRSANKIEGFSEAMQKIAADPDLRMLLSDGAKSVFSGISLMDSAAVWKEKLDLESVLRSERA